MYPDWPQSITIGSGDASINCTALLRLLDHESSGPSSVRLQSNARMRPAISPFHPEHPWLSSRNCIGWLYPGKLHPFVSSILHAIRFIEV
ncbi:hypothetical protein D3C81_1423140 [compost metagenome]